MPTSALEFEPPVEEVVSASVEDVVVEAKPKTKRSKPKRLPVVETIRAPRRKPPKLLLSRRTSWARIPILVEEPAEIEDKPAEIIEYVRAPRRSPPRLLSALRGSWSPFSASESNRVENAGAVIFVDSQIPFSEQPKECDVDTKRIVEAILFAANKPMSVKQIQQAFPELEQPDTLEIQQAIEAISQDYLARPIGLKQLASGYRFQIKDGMAHWVTRLFEEKPPRYSRAMLETIAIIAYRQPVTRGEIEDIRGVSVSSGIIHTLLEREWIRVIAHKEVPGRPALYGTTKQFLDYFNLASLAELPTLQEIVDFDFGNASQLPPQQENSERTQTDSSEASEPATAEQEAEHTPQAAPDAELDTENLTFH
jgi:segregation and condensation protein B